MPADLRLFLAAWLAAVMFTLMPVAVTAFVSIPWSLGHHPGEPAAPDAPVRHMT